MDQEIFMRSYSLRCALPVFRSFAPRISSGKGSPSAHTAPSSKYSFFHMGTVFFKVSMIQRQASKAGQTTCEMPGQFAVRGGIIDVFSPETPQPVRIELLGDTIESIRAFDPNTQRSTNPVERVTLMPLTEFPD